MTREYLSDPSQPVWLLVEIDTPDGTVYLSDNTYITEPGDTPANRYYWPLIAKNGAPRLARRLADFSGGAAGVTWGDLELLHHVACGVDLASADLRGREVRVYVAGSPERYGFETRTQVLVGRVGLRRGRSDASLIIEMTDASQALQDLTLPVQLFGAEAPAARQGSPVPLALGRCFNVAPVLVDFAAQTYQVSAGPIQAITAVYDQAVPLLEVSRDPQPGEYSVNLASGTVTLGGTPAGQITADVQGLKVAGIWLSTLQDIAAWIADQAGLELVTKDLPGGQIGYYLDESVTTADLLTELCAGCLAFWFVDRSGWLCIQGVDVSTDAVRRFGQRQQIGELEYTELDEQYSRLPVQYRRNWSQGDPVAGAPADLRDYYRQPGLRVAVGSDDGRTAPLYESWFTNEEAAVALADRALRVYAKNRRSVRLTVAYPEIALSLGDAVRIVDASICSGVGWISSIEERWDAEVPVVDLEVLV